MTDEQTPKGKMPTWGQGLLLGGAGVILAAGGCATFLSMGEGLLGGLGAIAFMGGVLAILIGGIMFLVGVIKALFFTPNENG
jgi:hypothetical protein